MKGSQVHGRPTTRHWAVKCDETQTLRRKNTKELLVIGIDATKRPFVHVRLMSFYFSFVVVEVRSINSSRYNNHQSITNQSPVNSSQYNNAQFTDEKYSSFHMENRDRMLLLSATALLLYTADKRTDEMQ